MRKKLGIWSNWTQLKYNDEFIDTILENRNHKKDYVENLNHAYPQFNSIKCELYTCKVMVHTIMNLYIR